MVILAVRKEKSLQTVTNYLIVSLASADLLVATCVMFFAVYFEVSHPQQLALKTQALSHPVQLLRLGPGAHAVQSVHRRRRCLLNSFHPQLVGYINR
jgi:hypothetical protein